MKGGIIGLSGITALLPLVALVEAKNGRKSDFIDQKGGAHQI